VAASLRVVQAVVAQVEDGSFGVDLGEVVEVVVGWLPTWGRRLRVGLDWAVAGAMPRDIVELGSLGHPGPLTAEDAGR
jgi:hypothetical protein